MSIIDLRETNLEPEGKMFRLFFAIGLVLFTVCPEALAQACGYSHAKFFVTDVSGTPITDARFEFLEKDSDRPALHKRNRDLIKWSADDAAYSLSEGMCGGHYGVMVRISSKGFESIERIIDLPLNNFRHPLVYRVRLGKQGANERSSFEYVSNLNGKVFDPNGSLVPGAKISAMHLDGRIFTATSNDNGEYTIELPYNRYDRSREFREAKYKVAVEKAGFAIHAIEYIFIPSQIGSMNLDIGLVVLAPSPSP